MDVRRTVDFGLLEPAMVIEPARPADLAKLLTLPQSLPQAAWQSAIARENVVCAWTNERLQMGAYVADHYSEAFEGDRLRTLQAAFNVMSNRLKLDEATVAFGARALISPIYLDAGDLRGHLLRALLRTVGLRYRHLFGFCSKQNPDELSALQQEGWRCFHEEDEMCYLTLDVAKTLRMLASRLALRMPARSHSSPSSNSISL